MPDMAVPMQRLAGTLQKKRRPVTRVDMFLVHQRPKTRVRTQALAHGVRALAWQEFASQL
jgi:hypothetical protein